MALETASPVAAAQGSVGIMALLASAYGPNVADVGLVIMSALCGCFIALSAVKNNIDEHWFSAFIRTVRFIVIGVFSALVMAWGLTSLVVSAVPSLNGVYTPTLIAMGAGFMCDKYAALFDIIYLKIIDAIGSKKAPAKEPGDA